MEVTLAASRDRKLNRRRKANFRTPAEERVAESVSELTEAARSFANRDHGYSFSSKKERDRIASVYLIRAADNLTAPASRSSKKVEE